MIRYMTQDMTYRNRYILRLTVLLTVLFAGGNTMAQVTVNGNVYGGGNLADVGGNVTVNMSGGIVANDVYGGGAKASTNTDNWNFDGGDEYEPVDVIVGTTVVYGLYEYTAPSTYTKVTTVGQKAETGIVYRKKVGVWKESTETTGGYIAATSTTPSSTYYKTTVNLLGGTINGNAYGGGLGEGQGATGTPAYVYGDVKVNLNGLEASTDIDDTTLASLNTGTNALLDENNKVKSTVKGCVVTRVFGCNNLNGTPKGHVKVNVYATQNVSASTIAGNKTKTGRHTGMEDPNDPTTYDVTAVYGGGNLSPYEPVDAYSNATKEAAQSEVYIYGCDLTSIKQVYGGGNAASSPATYVLVDGAYEIEELFGGGNGKDNYSLKEGTETIWYANPGANVGYTNYTYVIKNGETGYNAATHGSGTSTVPYKAIEYDNAKTKAGRQTATNGYMYGSGVAKVEVLGGTIHASYGGSNTRGNVCTEAFSKYEEGGSCNLNVIETYGGGKDSEIDGVINLNVGCVKNMDQIFGGSKNAPVYSDIVLNIHNGHYHQVFGGNNTSGAIHGSITVNIEEKGCVPIDIDELYIGGYLAPYSIYGYKDDGTPLKEGETGALTTPYKQPRLNVVSASRIGDIFGGGYQATVVGAPHVNVNMEAGKVEVTKTEITAAQAATDEYSAYAFSESGKYYIYTYKYYTSATAYTEYKVKKDVNIETISGKSYAPLTLGTIENVYGGGNQADIIGDTYVEIGTGKWLKQGTNDVWETKGSDGKIYTYKKKTASDTELKWYDNSDNEPPATTTLFARKTATITGDVFGGGKGLNTDATSAMIQGSTNIQIDNGTIARSVYGGGELAQVSGNTNINVTGTTTTTIIGTSGMGAVTHGNVYGGGMGEKPNETTGATDLRFGLIKGNTNVNISGGHILHNVYGGGAYGSVGTYTYSDDTPNATLNGYTTGGTTNVNITGGTIGTNGDENGMVFGSSRGDVAKPVFGTPAVDPNDRLAWVYNANVTIGTSNDATIGPQIKGSIYGSGENGHTYNDTDVKIYSGTIGIATGEDIDSYSGAAYPYRGNVYGGGCGTDMYDSDNSGTADSFNPLAGIVYGNANVTITGGQVVHNVYGAGAMGSVGKVTTTTSGTTTTTTITGGATTIAISGGIIGVSGTVDDGNIYGAARGNLNAPQGYAVVKTTNVNISGTATGTIIYGSVYGGGALGDVGTYTTSADDTNTYQGGSGACAVTITGGTVHQNVFGAGMGDATTYQCKKAMANSASVTIANGTVGGSVYGGGQIARVENNTEVKIGAGADGTTTYYKKNTDDSYSAVTPAEGANLAGLYFRSGEEGSYTYTVISASQPEITGNVFGAGKGLETHGYSALVRGNSSVTIEGKAKVRHNVYGGGEIATVGRYKVALPTDIATVKQTYPEIEVGMPYEKKSGGKCTVIVRGDAEVGPDAAASVSETAGQVFGAGKGVGPDIFNSYAYTAGDKSTMPWRMTTDPGDEEKAKIVYDPYTTGYIKEYYPTLTAYFKYLETLALATETDVTIGGNAKVKGNVYGGSESGFVQDDTDVKILNGTIGTEGTKTYGNIFGGGKGLSSFDKAGRVKRDAKVTIDDGTAYGTVYGGGELGFVGSFTYDSGTKTYTWQDIDSKPSGLCTVIINDGTITGYVYGAGKGDDDTFECDKAMVRKTDVSIYAGTVNHNVYGGGELGRVDQDTKVTIGTGDGTSGGSDAIIGGEVFGAGAGVETHGYSALVRGNSEVIVQGNAKVGGSVYGGGEIAAVGRYKVDPVTEMPTDLVSGGKCKVTVKGYAVVGQSGTGNVFGAGKGINPSDATHTYIDFTKTDKTKLPKRMTLTPSTLPTIYDNVGDGSKYIWEYYTSQTSYFNFLQTLALATDTEVSIEGNATVKNNVYGGSESGFVQRDTDVKIKGGAIGTTGSATDGNIFGGGKGLDVFAEAGRVRGNATVAISNGNIAANVYGGGELGHVGSFTETADGRYVMDQIKDKDGEDMDTGLCTVTITGGKVGSDSNTDSKKGNVFGAGKGKDDTFKCEKAMVMNTSVSISTGAVNGDVFGGGEVGRVEYNSAVTMGSGSVKRSVFGGGAGVETHGYSALVRGNTKVCIEGGSVGESVYGGGEIASVGRYGLDAQKMPSILLGGGVDTVTVKGSAAITGDVFGAGKGVDPHFDKDNGIKANRSRRMTVYNADEFPESAKLSTTGTATPYEGSTWEYFDESVTPKLVWEYFQDETKYKDYLKTLALATKPIVTIDGNATINGSVFGGGELGITKGSVFVNILGGTIEKDVYGGGSLADTNTTSSVGKKNADESPQYETDGKTIKTETVHPTTKVNLLGGHIMGDAYGGGLGQLDLPASGIPAIEAKVFGDVKVNLNGLQSSEDMDATTVSTLTSLENGGTGYKRVKSSSKGCAVTRIFGCNNLNGSPQKKVQVYVYGTQNASKATVSTDKTDNNLKNGTYGPYDVQAVYGGGNLSPYVPADPDLTTTTLNETTERTEVYIDGCSVTSIKQVYGGGNAASVPATFVQVNRCYEIDEVFGGGNGFDNYSLKEGNATVWYENPGANVGYYTGYYTNYATYSNHATRVPGGGGSGTSASDPYKAVVNAAYAGDADKKTARLAETSIQYGSGIATLEVKGGTVHTAFGGSNSKGNVRAKLASLYSAAFDDCTMAVDKSYGGGKNAYSDADAEVNADCAKGVKVLFGGSENADFDGNIDMHITNGSSLEKVFGGNNTSGAVNGSITITLEEGGCEPIHIDELYLGGFLAPYSVYGYERNATDNTYVTEDVKYVDTDGSIKTKTQRKPKESGMRLYPDPRINVISATYIGEIFGGGYQAKLVGNPHINVNMTTGFVKVTKTEKDATDTSTDPNEFTDPEDGKTYIYKDVANNTYDPETVSAPDPTKPTELIATTAIGTIGNIYGGGNMADIIGDTYVEIGTGTQHNAAGTELVTISPARNAAHITGDVYGGGKGVDDSFFCDKAMVGKEGDGVDHPDGGTHVTIGNGTVDGNVYGGGMIGRVEKNTVVTIGLENAEAGTSSPLIKGSVFGGGKGKETHGYAALVRGNPTVTIQADAKVEGNVYGGGEIASVARYNVPQNEDDVKAAIAAGYDAHLGMPYALANDWSGNCNVTVRDNAEIGPNGMKMYHEGEADDKPDDKGHVFGAGKGILPKIYDYDPTDKTTMPRRMVLYDDEVHTTANSDYWEYVSTTDNVNVWEYFPNEEKYFEFIQTLALASKTKVTIGGEGSDPFIKGSVYGGSENGLVQFDTEVKIQSGQIGAGDGVNVRYTAAQWESEDPTVLKECASWEYKAPYAPYDPNANATVDLDKYPLVTGQTEAKSTEGGRRIASDGHTYYGNVFGGGSGSVPYFDTKQGISKYLSSAGTVKGNTKVEITGGHILTNVYGGCEATNVLGKATVKMTGGTIGVPRDHEMILKHPVVCNLFGAGKGDQRIFFNKETNVNDAEVEIDGGRIYGSVFGGGEDGHVLRDVTLTIKETSATKPTTIGSTGTTYMDGNVFGGGRGFGGGALTAGNVGGSITVNMEGGTLLGSLYGGGRLASVGYGLYLSTGEEAAKYGQMRADDEYDGSYPNPSKLTAAEYYTNGRGYITVNIKGGTIGNGSADAIHSGNVFGASMGRLTKLDNTTANDIWPLMATAKKATVNITNGIIQRNVYGGGEMGRVTTDTKVNIEGGTINGSVFGGGYGSDDYTKYVVTDAGKTYRPILFAGRVEGNTNIEATKGTVKGNVYGGGEMATVGLIENVFDLDKKDADEKYIYRHDYPEKAGDGALYSFGLSWPYQFDYDQNTGLATIEIKKEAKVEGYVFGAGKGKIELGETDITKHRFVEALIANVRATQVTIGETTGDTQPTISNSVYGGGEDGHVYEDASIIINNGTIAHSVFGAGKGESTFAGKRREAQVNPADPADLSLYTDVDDPKIHSWIAGKVFGNTFITMNGGSVGYNIYGGGNLASIGKGNYAGGQDDYSTVGYGELPLDDNSNIWTSTFKPDEAVSATNKPDFAYHFTSSGKATITINSGTVGTAASATAAEIYGNVFGSSRGKAAFDVGRRSPRFKYVPDFFLGYVNDTEITIGSADASYTGSAPVIKGSVYGGGQDGHVRRSTKVTINKGTIGDYTGLTDAQKKEVGNVFGAGSGMGKYDSNGDGTVDAYNNSSGSVTCTTRVDIKPGVTVIGSVYGGGAMGSVGPPNTGQGDETNTPTTTHMSSTSTLVNIEGGNISGSVYGSSRGDADLEKQYPHTYATNLWSTVNMSDGNVGGSVFGGGEAGNVKCDVDVEISGGNIAGDVYGGGALARTNTSNWTYNASSKTWGTTWAAGKYLEPTSTMPIYHTTYKTTVNLKGGTINGNVYGGGLGRKAEGTDPGVEAKVYGDVLVTLNGTKTTTTSGTTTTDAYNDNCKVKGSIFGCNNLNGSPQSAVTVHVYKTQGYDDSHTKSAGKDASTFDLAAVYGGGNQAAFMPDLKATADTVMTHVIIEGCDRTSIKQVYGGGNAASAPATNVTVKSAYEIEELFGGGNGFGYMDAANTIPNPGANVGFKDYHLVEDTYNTKELRVETAEFLNNYVYGSGKASLDVYGGRIHRVFGGSNTKGNVRETAITMLDNQDACTLEIDEVYGGGKSAPMDAEAKLLMACIPGLNAVYGGAQEADIQNNVELNITNGTFNRVFGGNNISGTIRGSITVNIEETGCQPIIIGELYGGGNLAGYSVYGYNDDKSLKQTGTTKLYHDPVVNVKSFTSIGNIYGGGYGESAVMVGDPTVNISVALGDKANEDAAEIKYGVNDKTPGGFAVPTHEKGKIGAINNVFGGGNAAKVVGNTNVNIGTLTEVYVTIPDNDIKVGVTDVQNFYKRTGAGTAASPYVYTQVNGPVAPATTVPAQNGVTYYKKLSVQGADIRGNVYGGGNAADVSGKTNVVVGKED